LNTYFLKIIVNLIVLAAFYNLSSKSFAEIVGEQGERSVNKMLSNDFISNANGSSILDSVEKPSVGFIPLKIKNGTVNSINTKFIDELRGLNGESLLSKPTPVKEITLPGLIRIPGISAQMIDPKRGQIVEFSNGGSTSVYVSVSDINLLQLPFTQPLITSSDDVEIKQSGGNVYFQFKSGVNRAVQLFVENQSGSNSVLSLQLIPKPIVSQVIKVVDNSPASNFISQDKLSNEYIKHIQQLMEMVANEQNPSGFTKISLDHIAPILLNGLLIRPLSRMSNLNKEIYVYEAQNPGSAVASISEKEFDDQSVLAISIFPTPILRKNETTKIIILAKKQSPTAMNYD